MLNQLSSETGLLQRLTGIDKTIDTPSVVILDIIVL